MAQQFLRPARHAEAGDVFRRRQEHPAHRKDAPCDQRFRSRLEKLQGDIETHLDRIDHAIIDEDIEDDVRVSFLVLVQHA